MTTTAAPLHTQASLIATEMVVRRLVINSKVFSKDYIVNISKVIDNTKGALTTTYGNDLESQLNKLIQKYPLSNEQDMILRDLTQKLIEIERVNHTSFNLVTGKATDDEIIISRKCAEGIGLISVDPYGSIMVHFAGYMEGKKINFYSMDDYDAETVIFDFLLP